MSSTLTIIVTIGSGGVECPILGGGSKSHVICGHVIRSGEVSDYSLRGCDAHVSNERKEPGEARNGSPYDGVRISLEFVIYLRHLI